MRKVHSCPHDPQTWKVVIKGFFVVVVVVVEKMMRMMRKTCCCCWMMMTMVHFRPSTENGAY